MRSAMIPQALLEERRRLGHDRFDARFVVVRAVRGRTRSPVLDIQLAVDGAALRIVDSADAWHVDLRDPVSP